MRTGDAGTVQRLLTAKPVRVVALLLMCGAGAIGGAVAAGRTHAEIGPFHATVSLRLSSTGDTFVRLAPLGTLRLDTHDGPLGLVATADELDVADAQRVVEDPSTLSAVDDDAARDAREAIRAVLLRAVAGAMAGALLVAGLRRPARRTLALGALAAVVATVAIAGTARATWNPHAVAEPRYTGLLTVAPQAIGSIEQVRAQYDAYRSQLTRLIGNVAELYKTTAGLTSFTASTDTVRVLHVSDLHLNPQAFDLIGQLVRQFKIDAVVDTGDINDWGTAAEAQFVERIGTLGVPYVFVRGNHDSAATAAAVAAQPNAVVLEGEGRLVAGLRFWGIGDPRFTPDKSSAPDAGQESQVADRFAPEVARRLRDHGSVDVVAVHDPRVAAGLGGLSGVVLAGHLHRPGVQMLGAETRLLVEGSTGGAGLRALEKQESEPLACSILYFDRNDRSLRAFDRVTVTGLGQSGARIDRHVVPPDPAP
ncbi:MAG TPA: metallophosphoesterase [Acidimicrobiales bacterium]|nr:metallophosphoesterase [Acidimicrobiales bacterium]